MMILKLTQEEYLKIYRALDYCARVSVDTPTRSFKPTFADDAEAAKNLLASIKRRRKLPKLLSEDDANAKRKRLKAEARKIAKNWRRPNTLNKEKRTK